MKTNMKIIKYLCIAIIFYVAFYGLVVSSKKIENTYIVKICGEENNGVLISTHDRAFWQATFITQGCPEENYREEVISHGVLFVYSTRVLTIEE